MEYPYHSVRNSEDRPSLEQPSGAGQPDTRMHRQPLLQDGAPPSDNNPISKIQSSPTASRLESAAHSSLMWNPLWLHQGVLLGFSTAFILMALAVGLVYRLSEMDNGLASQNESRRYLWTFGPTAFLTIVMSFWGRVNFATRQLTPWTELRTGPSPAEKSILADYISPMFPVVVLDSFRRRHWAILISSFAVVLLKLTTAFSTGLMILEPTQMVAENIEFRLSSRFDATSFDANNMSGATIVGPISYAITAKGLPYPLGTAPDVVVQDFDTQDPGPALGVYSANVTGFNPDLDCKVVDVDTADVRDATFPWLNVVGMVFVVNISTPDCKIDNALVGQTADHSFVYRKNITQNYQGNIQNYTCNRQGNQLEPLNPGRSAADGHSDQRVLLTMADLRWSPISNGRDMPDLESYKVVGLTALLCRPTYLLNTYTVRKSASPNSSVISMDMSMSQSNTSRLKGFPIEQFAGSMVNTFEHMRLGPGGEDYVLTNPVPNFYQVLSAVNNDSGLEPFMDAQLLRNISTAVWRNTAVQYAREYLMVPANDSAIGSMLYNQNRIQVKRLTAISMMALLGALSFVSFGVWWFRPKPAVPRDPAPLVATAALLAASPDFSKLMTGLGAARTSAIRKATTGKCFRTTVSNEHFTLEMQDCKGLKPRPGQNSLKEEQVKWWRPAATRTWFLILTAFLSLAVAVLLIVLQQVSDTQQGILDIAPQFRVVPRYLTALIMLSIATLYSSIEGVSEIFAPFSRLKAGNASAQSTTEFNVVGKLLPHAILISAKNAHFQHVLSGIALFAAGFLTIIASGLYTVATVQVVETVTLRQMDSFNFNQGELSIDDRNAAATTSILEYTNLSYPSWTYGDLAFNKLDTLADLGGDGVINLNLSAYRATIDCIPYTVQENTIRVDGWPDGAEYSQFELDVSVPVRCVHNYTNHTKVQWSQVYLFPFNLPTFYSGKATWFTWGTGSEGDLTGDGAMTNHPFQGYSSWWWDLPTGNHGCPTFGFTIASSAVVPGGTSSNTTIKTNATLVMCTQHLEQLTANVTLRATDLSIDPAHPPAPDESTRKRLKSPATDSEVWEWPLNEFLLKMVDLSPTPQLQRFDSVDRADVNTEYFFPGIDGFIKTLVDGKVRTSIDSLVGTDEAHQAAFVNAGRRLYSLYMAQAISANMRDTKSRVDTDGSSGILTRAPGHRWRLRQNRGPAVALAALLCFLAAVTLLLIVVWDRAKVLPHNPCTIAGVASLLVGCEFSHNIVD
ncbi:uncharacterized protein BKCO1_27000101 [Diplodia corticola]|uniref:Uncharacterized protein n=1 Tax=Diplodia corticola TaxID=236234 RepID=A0A1J9S1G6_9PEZI|nr:uncharacterized protein BKCO1_27000101 [Diplodia corticola]OJD33860.1 hypothetical protein BKCO1_27000101 [Diplodia corticola]